MTGLQDYLLTELLGRGGFGTVYRAEQQEPIRRPVAVKVLNPGMDSREILARFAAEREALNRMDHPGIARLLDAGTTPQGRPYFVMELVAGPPLAITAASAGCRCANDAAVPAGARRDAARAPEGGAAPRPQLQQRAGRRSDGARSRRSSTSASPSR
jgi:hypothetical protein